MCIDFLKSEKKNEKKIETRRVGHLERNTENKKKLDGRVIRKDVWNGR